MRIKFSNCREGETPEEKLKMISLIDEQYRSRPLLPVTPQRNNKQFWVMDAWDNTLQDPALSPDRRKYSQKPVENSSSKNIRIKKMESLVDSHHHFQKFSTPQYDKNQANMIDKQNQYQPKVSSLRRPSKRHQDAIEPCSFKVPLSSIMYPMVRGSTREKSRRRIDRFHSFVTRSIRK